MTRLKLKMPNLRVKELRRRTRNDCLYWRRKEISRKNMTKFKNKMKSSRLKKKPRDSSTRRKCSISTFKKHTIRNWLWAKPESCS
jgi:hypothetical protein